jgi:hypothetical protein
VDAEPAGDYIALVVRLQAAADGMWYVHVDGTSQVASIPLAPATLVVRLWRSADTGLLRGTIGLHGSNYWAPIQSNLQLEELTRAWLSIGKNTTGGS